MSLPVRFLFLLLVPEVATAEVELDTHEMGRAMATLMVNPVSPPWPLCPPPQPPWPSP